MKFYSLIFVTLLFAYGWLGYNMYFDTLHDHDTFTVCLFKNLSGMPCPSCGSTRAILLLLEGNLLDSVKMNPLGIPMIAALLLFPFWVVFDLVMDRSSLINTFHQLEESLKKKYISYPAIGAVLLLWSWKILVN